MTKLRNLLIQFIFFAISGWIYEVVYTLWAWREFEHRGFLFGPWLPLYGFAGLILYTLFQKILHKPVRIGRVNIRLLLMFVYICILTTLIELGATYLLELFGIDFRILWDYSERAVQFEGRIALDASLLFGVLGLIIIYLVLPLYRRFIGMKHQKLVNAISWPVIVLFLIDVLARIPLGSNHIA